MIIPIENSTQRVVKFANKNYQNKVCLQPFSSIEVNVNGNVALCGCYNWMPTMIGSLLKNNIHELLSSTLAIDIRRSIYSGSYEYCNENTCGVIADNHLVDIGQLSIDDQNKVNNYTQYTMPREIFFAGDLTCNLSCPSCRTHVIKTPDHQHEIQQQLGELVKNNLFVTGTKDPITLHLSTTGEVFASTMLQSFLSTIPVKDFPNLSIWLQTNGLLAPRKWDAIGDAVQRVKNVTVTIDAANAETYEQLRRGGKWADLQKAMRFLQQKKSDLGITLHTRMVIQQGNSNQIEDFYNMSKDFDADKVEYARIERRNFFTDFDLMNVFDINHLDHTVTMKQLERIGQFSDVRIYG